MMKLCQSSIISLIEMSGFHKSPTNKLFFLTEVDSEISPAYCLNIIKNRGKVRLGGALGLYFRAFELTWRDSLSAHEKSIDFTLPLVMLVDNFSGLLDGDFFDYSDEPEKMHSNACALRRLCADLPLSIAQFENAVKYCQLIGKPISDYLHITEYNTDENLYFRKSCSFLFWFAQQWPEAADSLDDCLDDHQKRRLRL
jgi:hypothetical protein